MPGAATVGVLRRSVSSACQVVRALRSGDAQPTTSDGRTWKMLDTAYVQGTETRGARCCDGPVWTGSARMAVARFACFWDVPRGRAR